MTLTSQYAWLYNLYPFSNDPNAGVLHPDWWITECGCVPGRDHRRHRCHAPRSGRTTSTTSSACCWAGPYRAGDKVRLTVPAGSAPRP